MGLPCRARGSQSEAAAHAQVYHQSLVALDADQQVLRTPLDGENPTTFNAAL